MANFLQRLRNGLKAFNQQSTNESYNRFIYNFLGNNTISNNEYNDDYIEKGYAYNPTIYSLIQLISKSAITVPYNIYRKVDEGAMKEYKALTSNNLNEESVLKAKLLRKHTLEIVEHTALSKLLERPNPAQSWAVFLEEMIGFGKLTGNRFVYGITPEAGENRNIYYQLYNLPAHLIEIKSEGIFKPVSQYTMLYNDNKYNLDAEEVLHISDFNPDYSSDGSHLYGQSPIQAGMRVLTTANEAVETNLKFLHNQSARGMLTPDDDTLTPTQAKQMKDAFRRNFQGAKSANDVMITGKKFSWINFGLSTSDLQLLESYNATVKDLCNIYGVPVQLLNNTESTTYDNYRTARKVLFTNAVIPELNKIRDEFNRWLVPMFGEDLYFDFDYSAVPELMPEQEKLVDTLSKSYWLTSNEKREAQGYGVDEDNPVLNDYLVPSSFISMSDLDMDISDDSVFPETEPEEEVVEEEVIEEVREEVEEQKQMNAKLRKALQKKADDHNEKVGDVASKRTSVRTLYAVYKRGVGAFRTNPPDNRPSMNEDSWAFARVNSFLYALRNGRYRSGKHDTDLLPEGHPMSSKKNDKAISDEVYTSEREAQERANEIGCDLIHSHETDDGTVYMPCGDMNELEDALSKYYHDEEEERKQEFYDDYPKSVRANAKRAKSINEEHNNPCATLVGKGRATDLIAGKPLSLSIVKKTFAYLSRAHEYVTGKYLDEKGKPICGDVSYALWGGNIRATKVEDDAMWKWCKRIIDKSEE